MFLAQQWIYAIQTNKNCLTLKNKNKMKNVTKVIIASLALLGSATSSFAQATATASASANIITPIAISKTVDMNFGNIAVSASVSGTVILATSGSRTTGGSGGVTLPSTTGTVAAAEFAVSGEASLTYDITLPSSATLSDGSGNTMAVGTFTSNPSSTGTLSSGGTQTLLVGATLSVAAGQASGAYTNSTAVPVTVNYN
jgi:hypothetical protein